MTEDDLKAIEARLALGWPMQWNPKIQSVDALNEARLQLAGDVSRLVAEVRRLRALVGEEG
jgi:hypothetical protein